MLNKIIKKDDYKIVTTNKTLQIYKSDKLIGEARVLREKDFDFDTLYMFASRGEPKLLGGF